MPCSTAGRAPRIGSSGATAQSDTARSLTQQATVFSLVGADAVSSDSLNAIRSGTDGSGKRIMSALPIASGIAS